MAKLESDQDKNLMRLVSEELQKLSKQIETNANLVDKRIHRIQSEFDVEKIMKAIDKKLSKDDALIRFENFDSRLQRIDKKLKADF